METIQNSNAVLYETYAEIIIVNRYHREVARAKVDLDDVEIVKKYKWNLNLGYAVHYISSSECIWMHRIVMNTPKGKDTDRIYHNKLDNRKKNLRVCTRSENSMNRKKRKNTSSRYKGVRWRKDSSKWTAQISLNKKYIHLGLFLSENEAAKAYNNKAIELFGKFAYLNKINN